MSRRDTGLGAAAIGLVMIATAIVAGWLVVSSGILNAAPGDLGRPIKAEAGAPAAAAEESVRIAGALQLSQPRDPFKPLTEPLTEKRLGACHSRIARRNTAGNCAKAGA